MLLHAFGPLVTKVSVSEIKRHRVETLLSNHAQVKKKTRPKRQSKVESESKEAESSPTWQQDPEVLQQTKKAKNAKNLNPIVSE